MFSNVRGLALIIIVSPLAIAQAQTQTIYSPVILYREVGNPGRSFEMKEDGSGKQYLSQCPANALCGDLSHEGVQGQRHFIRIEPPSVDGDPNDLVVYSEDFSSRTVLISDKSFHPSGATNPLWSPDGSRVVFTEWWCTEQDPDNHCLKSSSGITVGDVVRDSAGMPVALVNEQRIAEANSGNGLFSPTWAPDNQRVAYSLDKFITNPDGTTRRELHVYLVYVPPPLSMDLPTTTEIIFGGGTSLNMLGLNFSPISRTDSQNHQFFKLAFRRLTDNRPYSRADIFTIEIPADYVGGYALTPLRITNSTNAKNVWGMTFFDWSPDGQWLAFDGAGGSGFTRDIYKIKSDGSAKAINLTNLKTQIYYSLTGWRR